MTLPPEGIEARGPKKPNCAGYGPGPRFNLLLARAANQTAADVRAGKFADPKEMATAFQGLVMSELLHDLLPPPAGVEGEPESGR
jgi:hypothetical protein